MSEIKDKPLAWRLRNWSNYDDPPGVTLGNLLDEAAGEIERHQADIEKLKDPVAVHINMLSGGIAKPSLANIKHLYPEVQQAFELVIEANNSLYGSQAYFYSLNGGPFDKYHLARGIEDLKARARLAALGVEV